MLSFLEEILLRFFLGSIGETEALFEFPFRRNFEATCCSLLVDGLFLSPEILIANLDHLRRTAHLHHLRGLLLMLLGFRLGL